MDNRIAPIMGISKQAASPPADRREPPLHAVPDGPPEHLQQELSTAAQTSMSLPSSKGSCPVTSS